MATVDGQHFAPDNYESETICRKSSGSAEERDRFAFALQQDGYTPMLGGDEDWVSGRRYRKYESGGKYCIVWNQAECDDDVR